MKEIYEDKTVRIYSQRELAEALGMKLPADAKVVVTNTSDDVSIVVRYQKEIHRGD